MFLHIRTHIEHRDVDGYYTDAHIYIPITRAQCNGIVPEGMKKCIEVFLVRPKTKVNINELNEFLGKEVFTPYQTYELAIETKYYPEVIAELPAEMPREYSTNPTRKVKSLIVHS